MSLFTISPLDLAAMYRALGSLYNAGVGPSHAFSFIAQDMQCRPLRRALVRLSEATASGVPVSQATGKFPNLFPALHRAILAAGEASGMMPSALKGLAQMVERDYALKESIKREMRPTKINLFATLFIAGVVIALGVMGFEGLSILGRVLLLFFSICTVAMFSAATLLTRINNEDEVWYGAILKRVPALGKVARMMAENHFTSVLGACYEAGILPIGCVQLAADACGSRSLRSDLMVGVPHIRDGMTLATSLEATNGLSDYLIAMLRIGEESGKVAEILGSAAEHQAAEIAASLQALRTYVTAGSNLAVVCLGGTYVLVCYGVL